MLGILRDEAQAPPNFEDIHRINCSVHDTVKELLRLEMLLQSKLETVKALGRLPPDPSPGPPYPYPGPNPPSPPDPPPDPTPGPAPDPPPDPPSNPSPGSSPAPSPYPTRHASSYLPARAGRKGRLRRKRRCNKNTGRTVCKKRNRKRTFVKKRTLRPQRKTCRGAARKIILCKVGNKCKVFLSLSSFKNWKACAKPSIRQRAC